MAQVRITKDIERHVRNQIREMFKKRIEAKTAELELHNIGQACYELHIPARMRQISQELNKDPQGLWVPVQEQIYITITFVRADGSHGIAHFQVPFRPPVPLPYRYAHGATRFVLRPGMPTYEEAKAIMLAVEQLHNERDQLLCQLVEGVLMKCTTLKQVLEHWPSVMDFLPEHIHHQHAAPEIKRIKAKREISIDDSTKAVLIKARLLNTQNGSSE